MLNLLKYYAVDSINAVIVSDQPHGESIYNTTEQGMSTVDNLLGKEMYSHLNEFSIEKKVTLNPSSPIECDLLVLDSTDLDYLEKNILKYSSHVSDIIFISKIDGVDKLIDLKDWEITEEDDCYILEYAPAEYSINSHSLVYNFYELMSATHDILVDAGVEYFLTKSSCLGAVRNRNHIVYDKCIHIGCDSKYKDTIENLRNTFKENNITLSGEKIILTDDVYIQIDYNPDVTVEEKSELKIYSYGPIKVFSLGNPIPYLYRIFGDKVFREMRIDIDSFSGIIKTPKRLYDCYYNSWSPYTSRYCKKIMVEHLKKTCENLTDKGIKCWIDCGTLLGAVRNGRIPLFDDDTDIGLFQVDNPNDIINDSIRYMTDFNAEKFYAGKLHEHVEQIEEINYMFTSGNITGTECRCYVEHENKYISVKDDLVSEAHGVSGLKMKRAVDKKYFDNDLEEIMLEGFKFKCPSNPFEYVTQDARYGKDSVDGNPIRNGKPGGDVLRDDWYE